MFCCCSVPKLCLTLWDPMDCSTPVFPVLHYLLEFAQTHIHWVSDATQPSHPVFPFSSCPQSFPASESFPMSWFFASDDQSIGASASASVFPISIQNWFPLGLTAREGNGTPLQYFAWKIPWMEEPGRLQSIGSLRVGHDWATSLSLFTFMH